MKKILKKQNLSKNLKQRVLKQADKELESTLATGEIPSKWKVINILRRIYKELR